MEVFNDSIEENICWIINFKSSVSGCYVKFRIVGKLIWLGCLAVCLILCRVFCNCLYEIESMRIFGVIYGCEIMWGYDSVRLWECESVRVCEWLWECESVSIWECVSDCESVRV